MRQNVLSSKLTTKCQATIPERVRKALGLKPGDSVAFDILPDARGVMLRKAQPVDFAFAGALEATLATEWLSKNDEDAYGDL